MTAPSYYHALFTAAGDSMVVRDEAGRAVDCNPAACALLACTREQLLGTTPLDWAPPLQPDGRASADHVADVLGRVHAGEAISFDWVNRRLNGESEASGKFSGTLSLFISDKMRVAVRHGL